MNMININYLTLVELHTLEAMLLLYIKRLLSTRPPAIPAAATPAPTVPTAKEGGIRLPKIEVPKYDGNVMNWKTFWEQYSVLIIQNPH